MADPSGHKSGQPPGLGWEQYLALPVEEHGSLTAVAWKLIAHGEDVANIERALRRLRTRGQRDGGAWGQRLLRTFGMPQSIVEKLRWLGLYHSPFSDLPVALCLDQLRLWDRPPIATSKARVYLHLGFASVALRLRDFAEATRQLDRADAATLDDLDKLEAALQRAYLVSRDDEVKVPPLLARADALFASAVMTEADRACFAARLVDQRAFQRNRSGAFAEALALYRALPTIDTHPFASFRRDTGIAFGLHRDGDRDGARQFAERAVRHAGDGGYVRLRAMGLLMLARVAGDRDALERAAAIADRLGDAELATRVTRQRAHEAES